MKVFRILGACICILAAANFAWLSIWILGRTHIPIGPMTGFLIALGLTRWLWPKKLNTGEPPEQIAIRTLKEDISRCLGEAQEIVFGRHRIAGESGSRISDWSPDFVRRWAAKHAELNNLIKVATALQQADSRAGRLGRTYGPRGGERAKALRLGQANITEAQELIQNIRSQR